MLIMPTTRRSSRRLSSAPLKEAASTRRVTRSTPAKRAAPALSRTSRSKRRLTLEKPKPSPRKSTRGRKKAVVESSSEEEAESSDDGESETKTVRRGSRKRKISKAMQEALKQNGKRAVKKKVSQTRANIRALTSYCQLPCLGMLSQA